MGLCEPLGPVAFAARPPPGFPLLLINALPLCFSWVTWVSVSRKNMAATCDGTSVLGGLVWPVSTRNL